MQWGFSRPWGKRPLNNARDDKLEGKTWHQAWESQRCIIPARRFFEWTGKTPKTKHSIAPDNDHWFWIAGLWEENSDEKIGLTYTMLTTSSNEQMTSFHSRMPVILHPENIEEYLRSESSPIHLIKPYEGDLLFDPPEPC